MKVNKTFSLDQRVFEWLNKKEGNMSERVNNILTFHMTKEEKGTCGASKCHECGRIFPDRLNECPHCQKEAEMKKIEEETNQILQAQQDKEREKKLRICGKCNGEYTTDELVPLKWQCPTDGCDNKLNWKTPKTEEGDNDSR